MSINLIGISGKIGAGKDTVGKIIQDLTAVKTSYGTTNVFEIKKFAGKLKQIVSLLTGIPVGDLEKQEVKDMKLGSEWNYSGYDFTGMPVVGSYTVRELLQQTGTEAMRDQIHENVWVNALFADYDPRVVARYNGHELEAYSHKWLITDVRFPNEAQAIKDRGGIVIRLNRSDDVRLGAFFKLQGIQPVQHPSETALDDYNFDEVIQNDGTIEELTEKVKQLLAKYEL